MRNEKVYLNEDKYMQHLESELEYYRDKCEALVDDNDYREGAVAEAKVHVKNLLNIIKEAGLQDTRLKDPQNAAE